MSARGWGPVGLAVAKWRANSLRGCWSPSRALARSGAVTAMMDNSDGLALSLSDLAQVSHVGFVVQEEALPVAAGLVEPEKARELVMSAGGDFELVFTVQPEGLEAAREACALTVIGEVVEEGIWMEREGQRRRVEARGYEHRIGGRI